MCLARCQLAYEDSFASLLPQETSCDGGGVTGTYTFESGTEKQLAELNVTLNDDKSFELVGPDPLGGDEVSIAGTYRLDGDKISPKTTDGTGSEPGTVDGDKPVFADVTWVKV